MANIIIVGCGRVGSQLATLLSQGDGNVCVVDRNAAAFSNLDRNFNGNTLQGVGFDEDVLVRAGVEEADRGRSPYFPRASCYRATLQPRARASLYAVGPRLCVRNLARC